MGKTITLTELKDKIKQLKTQQKTRPGEFRSGFNYAIWHVEDWLKLLKYGPTRKPPRKTKAEGCPSLERMLP